MASINALLRIRVLQQMPICTRWKGAWNINKIMHQILRNDKSEKIYIHIYLCVCVCVCVCEMRRLSVWAETRLVR